MSIEKQPQNNTMEPTELAPFRDSGVLPPREQLRLVKTLMEYSEEPFDASLFEAQRYGIDNPMNGNPEFEGLLREKTKQSLAWLAENGKLFITQELARAANNSPVVRILDSKWSIAPLVTHAPSLDSVKDEQSATRNSKGGLRVSPPDFSSYISSWEQQRNGVFAEAEHEYIDQGYVTEDKLEGDAVYSTLRSSSNLIARQNRLQQLAYELPKDDIEKEVLPFSFKMGVYGNRWNAASSLSDVMYEKIIRQEEVEYKEIIQEGYLYAPVRTASDVIGFYESIGRPVKLFHTTENLKPGEEAIEVDVQARIGELFASSDESEIRQIAQAHSMLAGDLSGRHILEKSFNMRLETVSLDDQLFLCNLLLRATPEQMQAIIPQGPEVIITVARALEFGDDFGDRILSIAEHTTPEESSRVFNTLKKYREHSKRFGAFFEGLDPELAAATENAMNERLSDLIATVEKVARDGAFTADVAPHRDSPDYEHDGRFDITVPSVEKAVEVMGQLETSLEHITTIAGNPETHVSRVVSNEEEAGYQIYRFGHPEFGDMLLYIRPEGAENYDKNFEYGNYKGVEASISFIVNPTGDHRLRSDKDPNGVSIRFDREGRLLNEAPNSQERSPIRNEGTISLDISSGLGKADAIPVGIGRSIAAGNQLRAEEEGSEVSLHHNTNYLDQEKYGSAEGFKKFARYVRAMAEGIITHQVGAKVVHLQDIEKLYKEVA